MRLELVLGWRISVPLQGTSISGVRDTCSDVDEIACETTEF
jgi:hypothetical protein